VSTTWLGISLGFFITLYVVLGVVDFVLMRRYANPSGAPPKATTEQAPAVTY
jgi:cytochrome bd-type quinol oxidase subunit 1